VRAPALPFAPVADGSSALVVTDEPPLVAPPAAPPGCSLERPVRTINVGDGPLSFATAAAGARSLLAISTSETSALLVTRSDGTLEALAPPFPRGTALSASGAASSMTIGWTIVATARLARAALATIDEAGGVRAFALDAVYSPVMTDVACARVDRGVRCAFAITDRDEFESVDGLEGGRMRLFSFDPRARGEALELERSSPVVGVRGSTIIDPVLPTASVIRDGGLARTVTDGGLESVDPRTLELATIGSSDRAVELRATAPTAASCQPAQWTLSFVETSRFASSARARIADAGATVIATVDARPRGVRLRSSGADGASPTVLWLDAPQCSERLFVIRANRRGQTVALTSATEFDAAADRALLSIAWREGDRVRWARYRCP